MDTVQLKRPTFNSQVAHQMLATHRCIELYRSMYRCIDGPLQLQLMLLLLLLPSQVGKELWQKCLPLIVSAGSACPSYRNTQNTRKVHWELFCKPSVLQTRRQFNRHRHSLLTGKVVFIIYSIIFYYVGYCSNNLFLSVGSEHTFDLWMFLIVSPAQLAGSTTRSNSMQHF